MAFALLNNVAIRGISACVPRHIEENASLPIFAPDEIERVIAQTGIERKHTVEQGTTVVDLCAHAFEQLLHELQWDRMSIDALILVSSAGDYITPPSSNVLHGILNLPETCLCFDIRQGCPGWIIGLEVAGSLVTTHNFRRVILLCGDSATLMKSPLDKESRPLFGDAGTATALEYDTEASPIELEHGSRGKEYHTIFAKAGGLRYPTTPSDLEFRTDDDNMTYRAIDSHMKGMDVFSFALATAPKSVQSLMNQFHIGMDTIDYFIFHQANQYLNEKIRKKLKIDSSKVPYSLRNFGNTGSATIPLTIVSQCRERYSTDTINTIACAFGVGLAWGSAHFITHHIVCPEVIFYDSL